MIKKISQLDKIPDAYLSSDEFYTNSLIELSYKINEPNNESNADELQYYMSYNTDLSTVLDKITESVMDNVINKAIVFGEDVDKENNIDRISDRYQTATDKSLKITSHFPIDLENDLIVHGKTQFHNNIAIKCTDTKSLDINSPVLSVQGVATFDNVINGVAFRAQWGDIAETYIADAFYPPGTLVCFGGDYEITIAKYSYGKDNLYTKQTSYANAVITSKPGILLNDNDRKDEKGVATNIALFGRVPVRINGQVKKFDRIVLSHDIPGTGVACEFPLDKNEIIGIALESNMSAGEKLVMCSVKMSF